MDNELGLVRTDHVVSARQLRRLLGTSSRDMRQSSTFVTHDGHWILERDGQWRFWEFPEVAADKDQRAA